MPLPPGGNQPWPPAYLKPAFDLMATLAAWWEGDAEKLSAAYGGTASTAPSSEHSFDRPSQYRGGLVGTVARMFWGQPTPPQQQRTKVHLPIASEIAVASADLLFSRSINVKFGDEEARRAIRDEAVAAEQEKADAAAEKAVEGADPDPLTGLPPAPQPEQVEVPEVEPDPAQVRFDQLREASGLDATLVEAAEIAAAMTGVYLRLVWDAEVQDGPWLDVVQPDSAVPEFRYGRLWAVTFWRDLTTDDDRRGGKVIRHLERHERGRILHGLYSGDRDTLGRPIPLTEAPDLEGIVEDLDNGNEIPTVEGRLTAAYVPNMRPAPQWRRSPQLAPLGRSDYTPGVLGLMDKLDETWSSWMRDIRLGKGRIQVPEQYLETQGRGKSAVFDEDREVYTKLNLLPQVGGPAQITATQFAIRVDEHERTCRTLLDAIVRAAGYSSQTFGSDAEGAAAATATEINAREKRSVLTREKKIRYWDGALTDLLYTWLLLDYALAGGKPAPAASDQAPESVSAAASEKKRPLFGKGKTPTKGPASDEQGDGEKTTEPPAKPKLGKLAATPPTKPATRTTETADDKGKPAGPETAAPVMPDGPPEIEWPALADADMLTLAQTAQAIFAASAASKYTLVRLLHPDWDEDQVQEELARMDEDAQAAAPPDPMAMGAEQPLGGGMPFGEEEPAEDDGAGGFPFQ